LLIDQCLVFGNRLTSEQDREIARLEQVLPKWREAATEILALHAEMKDHTIDKILEMDDVELGLEALRRTGLAEEHIDIARHIDSEIQRLLAAGGNEAVLKNMLDYMMDSKRLMDETGEVGVNALAAQFDGFHHFASLLERIAGAIHSGDIKVPPA